MFFESCSLTWFLDPMPEVSYHNDFKVNFSYSYDYTKLFGAECVIICLYADMLLSSHFEMKDLVKVDIILGEK